MELDMLKPWGFFDGAAHNNVCGGGALLYLSETHFFELSAGLGEGSNNFAEIMSLKLLLVFAAEKGVKTLHFMGDSSNVINWMNGTQLCSNIRLENILLTAREILDTFDEFTCCHIFRENSREAYLASKAGLQLVMGQWQIKEHINGSTLDYFHRPFIESTYILLLSTSHYYYEADIILCYIFCFLL